MAEAEIAIFDRNLQSSVSLKDTNTLKLWGFALATIVGSHWLADQASRNEWLSPYGGTIPQLQLQMQVTA